MTTDGRTCRRRTANPTGWCGRCAGIAANPAAANPAAGVAAVGPGPDPFAPTDDTPPAWEMPASTLELERLARSTRTDPDVLTAIAAHASEQADSSDPNGRERWDYQRVLRRLAKNPATPAETLLNLVGDGLRHSDTWGTALSNPAITEAALEAAAALNPWQAAQNPTASPALLEQLYRSDGSDRSGVRAQVVRHRNCPPAILAEAVLDDNRSVRIWALQNPNCPAVALEDAAAHYTARKATSADAEWAVANPSFPPHLLPGYASHPNRNVRRGVAANPQTPAETLADLAEDPNNFVRRAAARNQSTPTAAAGQIADTDPQWLNRRAAAARPDTPAAVLDRLAADPDHRVRAAVAGHHNTPASRLTGLAADPHPQVRKAAARNHNTSSAGKTAAGLLAD